MAVPPSPKFQLKVKGPVPVDWFWKLIVSGVVHPTGDEWVNAALTIPAT